MIKQFFSLTFITISLFSYSQQTIPVDEETKQALITEVIEVSGATQAELYDRAMVWINKFYPNPTGFIQSKDPATGEIVGKAQFRITSTDKKGTESFDGMVGYTIKLNFKDGKFKYEISKINWKQASYYDVSKWMNTKDQYYKEVYQGYLQQTNTYFDNLKADLKKAVKSPPAKKKDDW
ncbi:MAG: DUF4468 domain-containing protein [Bacteroidia bacterium]